MGVGGDPDLQRVGVGFRIGVNGVMKTMMKLDTVMIYDSKTLQITSCTLKGEFSGRHIHTN